MDTWSKLNRFLFDVRSCGRTRSANLASSRKGEQQKGRQRDVPVGLSVSFILDPMDLMRRALCKARRNVIQLRILNYQTYSSRMRCFV